MNEIEEIRMSNLRGKVAIVGIGEVPTGRFPEKAAIYHAIESARLAIKDAGINKDEIDFVMPTAALFSPQFNTELVTCRIIEELGLRNAKVVGVVSPLRTVRTPSWGVSIVGPADCAAARGAAITLRSSMMLSAMKPALIQNPLTFISFYSFSNDCLALTRAITVPPGLLE